MNNNIPLNDQVYSFTPKNYNKKTYHHLTKIL